VTTEQPNEAPAPSGLFRDIMATFGGVNFRMPCRPDEEEEGDADAGGDLADAEDDESA
jgi:hypothetical protein